MSGRRRLLAALALSLYGLLAAISPALHHDLACHVKSPGHCDACVANPLASRTVAPRSSDRATRDMDLGPLTRPSQIGLRITGFVTVSRDKLATYFLTGG